MRSYLAKVEEGVIRLFPLQNSEHSLDLIVLVVFVLHIVIDARDFL